MKRPLSRVLRCALWCAFACSFTTAAVSGLGRTFCLPPYWPPESVLRCRQGRMLEALVRTPLDVAMTTLLLFVPALVPGAVTAVLLYLSRRDRQADRWPRAGIAIACAAMWFLLVNRLEPGYLDFIIGGYATGAGAIAGALAADRTARSFLPGAADATGE